MRYLTAVVFLIATIFSACNNSVNNPVSQAPETRSIAESRHSAAFNQSIQAALQTYYHLAEAFVHWDSVTVSSRAKELTNKLDSLHLGELKKDTIANAEAYLTDAQKELNGMMAAKDITTKRHALNALTGHLYRFLSAVKYDRQKLYLQECPMAFNDAESGVWLSAGDSIRNPYLGLHHPRYGKGMLECGDNKEVLNFTGSK
jgi:hypothetical protein